MMGRPSMMGGARMFRAIGRSVGSGVKDRLSSAAGGGSKREKTGRVVSVSPAPPLNRGSLTCCDGDEWETIGDEEGGDGFGFYERVVFGPVPSEEEAEEAVSTIQRIFVPVTFSQVAEVEYPPSVDEDVVDKVGTSTDVTHRDCATKSESDWIEPELYLYSSKSSQSYGQENILDAVRLFQINPPFKRMVTSLSSDPAVWDAVMKNDVVQELKKSFYEAERSEPRVVDEDPDIPTGILRWIMENTKGKIMEFFDKISKLVNEIFHPHEKDKESEAFDDFVRSSFTLSVVVFIIVVMTRIQKS